MNGVTFFKPVTLDLLEEQLFMKRAEGAFQKLQQQFIDTARKHKADCKAKLVIEVEMIFEKEQYHISTDIVSRNAKPPKSFGSAHPQQNQDGSMTLWAPVTGTSPVDSHQPVLCRTDGAPMNYDEETGEIIEDRE